MRARLFFLIIWSTTAALAQNRSKVSSAEVTGTYRDESGSNEFRILAVGNNRLKVQFDGSYVYRTTPDGPMANVGFASGLADIEADIAMFKPDASDDCTLVLTFLRGNKLGVDQRGQGTCGFGHNVTAGGRYRKISSRKPKFEDD